MPLAFNKIISSNSVFQTPVAELQCSKSSSRVGLLVNTVLLPDGRYKSSVEKDHHYSLLVVVLRLYYLVAMSEVQYAYLSCHRVLPVLVEGTAVKECRTSL